MQIKEREQDLDRAASAAAEDVAEGHDAAVHVAAGVDPVATDVQDPGLDIHLQDPDQDDPEDLEPEGLCKEQDFGDRWDHYNLLEGLVGVDEAPELEAHCNRQQDGCMVMTRGNHLFLPGCHLFHLAELHHLVVVGIVAAARIRTEDVAAGEVDSKEEDLEEAEEEESCTAGLLTSCETGHDHHSGGNAKLEL